MSSNALFLQGRTSIQRITHPRIIPNGAVTEHPLRPTPETPSSAPNCPGSAKLERLNSACSSAKRADAVRISHTHTTPHSILHICLFLFLIKRASLPACPLHRLHAHSLSFSSVAIVAIRHNCRSLHHCELVQAQSPRRLPVLITVPPHHNKLVSSSLHLSPNQNTHFHLATPTLSFTKRTYLYQRRPLTDNPHQQLERHP